MAKEIIKELQSDEVLNAVGGISGTEIRKNAEKLGLAFDPSITDEQLMESAKKGVSEFKKMSVEEVENLLGQISGGNNAPVANAQDNPGFFTKTWNKTKNDTKETWEFVKDHKAATAVVLSSTVGLTLLGTAATKAIMNRKLKK